jgi:hypothetical protein
MIGGDVVITPDPVCIRERRAVIEIEHRIFTR